MIEAAPWFERRGHSARVRAPASFCGAPTPSDCQNANPVLLRCWRPEYRGVEVPASDGGNIMKMLVSMTLSGLLLAGCGVGEVAVTAAAEGSAKAQEARQAQETEARVSRDLDAAAKLDTERRQAAESAAQ